MQFTRTALSVAAFVSLGVTPLLAAELPVEELTTDVVVVGAGATGLSAAATASEAGARVIVFEKLFMTGGSSALSGGAIAAGETKWQKENGMNLPAQGFADIWLDDQKHSLPGGNAAYPNEKAVRRLTAQFTEAVDWLHETVGHPYATPRPFGWGGPNYAHAPAQMPVPPSGRGSLETGGRFVTQALQKYAEDHGAKVYVSTPVEEVTVNDKGEVTGVVAKTKNKIYRVKAKAVVLASGGFSHNFDMMKERVPVYAQYVKNSVATVGDTGDGLRMALQVGAAEVKDSWVIGLFLSGAKPELTNTFRTKYGYKECVFVNPEGKRFVKEDLSYVTDYIATQASAWAIVDSSDPEKVKPLVGLDDPAVAVSGNTWAELAAKIGAPAENLEKTMADYNRAAETGKDTLYNKEAQYLSPRSKAPFYAVRVIPQTGGTMGGVETDEHFRVLRADGSVIKGLYAGGEMANRQFYNRTYSSGSSLAIAITSGRIAGKDAANLVK